MKTREATYSRFRTAIESAFWGQCFVALLHRLPADTAAQEADLALKAFIERYRRQLEEEADEDFGVVDIEDLDTDEPMAGVRTLRPVRKPRDNN